MKFFNKCKFKAFPYAVVQKKGNQQWNPLAKLSLNRKRLFKNKSRFFSMEYGRSLSKRILWQVAVPQPLILLKSSFLFSESKKIIKNTKIQKKAKTAVFKQHTGGNTIFQRDVGLSPVFQKKTGPASLAFNKSKEGSICFDKKQKEFPFLRNIVFRSFSQTWSHFRSVFFGKMWVLNNPSLVPGVVRPVKSKKILLAKLRAFKGLTRLVGNSNIKLLVNSLRKLWTLSSQTTPSLWSVASGLDSLQTTTLLKSGFLFTVPVAFNSLSCGKVFVNGEGKFGSSKKSLSFSYPGDVFKIKSSNFNIMFSFSKEAKSTTSCRNNCVISEKNNILGKLFTYGSTTKKTSIQNNVINSIYLIKPFVWLSSFYNYGNILDFFGKHRKLPGKRGYYKKRFARKSLSQLNTLNFQQKKFPTTHPENRKHF